MSIYNVNNKARQEERYQHITEKTYAASTQEFPVQQGFASDEVLNDICNVNSSFNSQLFFFFLPALYKTNGSFNFILGILFSLKCSWNHRVMKLACLAHISSF